MAEYPIELGLLRQWKLRRVLTKRRGQRGVVVMAKFGPVVHLHWPYTQGDIGVRINRKIKGFYGWRDGPKWLPIPDGSPTITAIFKEGLRELDLSAFDLDNGLVLYLEPYKKSGAIGKAFLAANDVSAPYPSVERQE